MVERVDTSVHRLLIAIDQQFHATFLCHAVAQFIHFLKLPRSIYMQQREGRRRGIKRLAREMQHYRAVLTHAIQHHRLFQFGHDFTHDVDRFGLKPFQMGQCARHSGQVPLGRNAEISDICSICLNLPFGRV